MGRFPIVEDLITVLDDAKQGRDTACNEQQTECSLEREREGAGFCEQIACGSVEELS